MMLSIDKVSTVLFAIFQTSNSACFLLYEIAKHPELQERLVQEVSSAVGEKDHPSWDDLQKMPLLRNCVKETMRLYNPTGEFIRTIEEDVVLLGYQVPAGVSYIIMLIRVFWKTNSDPHALFMQFKMLNETSSHLYTL